VRKGVSMKWILYVVLTVFLDNGEPAQHEFKISFDKVEKCNEFKKVVDVGVSFFRLANGGEINYSGNCKKVIVSKNIKGGLL